MPNLPQFGNPKQNSPGTCFKGFLNLDFGFLEYVYESTKSWVRDCTCRSSGGMCRRSGLSDAGCRTARCLSDTARDQGTGVRRREPRSVAMVADVARPATERPHRARAAEQSRSQDRTGPFAAGEIAARRHRQSGAARTEWLGGRWRRHRVGRNQGPGVAAAEVRGQRHRSQEHQPDRRSRRRVGDRCVRQDRPPRRVSDLYRGSTQGGARLGLCRDRRRRLSFVL